MYFRPGAGKAASGYPCSALSPHGFVSVWVCALRNGSDGAKTSQRYIVWPSHFGTIS